MSHYNPNIASSAEIERLLFHLATVARTAKNDRTKGFAQSIIRQSYRRGWTPSAKQLPVMRELVSYLFRRSGDGDDEFEVIDGA